MKNWFSTSTTVSLIVVSLVCTSAMNAYAQFYRSGPESYVGIEVSAGTRQFSFRSTIPDIHGMKVSGEGLNAGVLIGSEAVMGKVRLGLFETSSLARHKVKMSEGELSMHIFPLYILGRESKLIKPYSLIGLDRAQLKLYGDFEIPQPPPGMPANPDCVCTCMPPPVLDEPVPVESDSETENGLRGRFNVTRFNLGAGVMVHIPKSNKFVNMFADVRYGWAIGERPLDHAFDQTKVSHQLNVNVGINFGLRY